MKRIPHTVKQGFVKGFTIELTYCIQLIGYGEHDMKMLYIQSIAHTVFGPKHLTGYLTFGAMAIATTIITETFVRTAIVIAQVFMSAKLCRAALL